MSTLGGAFAGLLGQLRMRRGPAVLRAVPVSEK